MASFANTANGHRVSVSPAGAFFGTLVFGFGYFIWRGSWKHAILSFLLAVFTLGLSWLIYPFFAASIVRNMYLERGYIIVEADPQGISGWPRVLFGGFVLAAATFMLVRLIGNERNTSSDSAIPPLPLGSTLVGHAVKESPGRSPIGGPNETDGNDATRTDRSAMKLVDVWLAAQINRDFGAYTRLYAPEFTGLKRVGAYTKEFDRAGWLADRRGMFARPMSVSAAGRTVERAGEAMVMRFTQTWVSGDFHDEGAKQLTLRMVSGQILIVHEEMLTSNVAPAAPVDDSSAP